MKSFLGLSIKIRSVYTDKKKQTSCVDGNYGIAGCGVFKAGIQNWKGFCIKINCSQMKLLNFENWDNGEPQQLAKIRVFKVDYFDFSCKKIE